MLRGRPAFSTLGQAIGTGSSLHRHRLCASASACRLEPVPIACPS